ncbi:hypothetical protein TrLO_g15043 [Triparma laevis f. longispina]|uniref:BD-FAE-like domain-containing protein n=1 Tax=Triparma laevis f. longispina TaxID=1714387 RepID=A0A9W7DYZ2_9STRA|nr:hypothetical protein TrLO_g15043 [Triparma laevis f. longispina]
MSPKLRTNVQVPSHKNAPDSPKTRKSERRAHKSQIRSIRKGLYKKSDGLAAFPFVYHLNLITSNASLLFSYLIKGTWTWVYMLGRLGLFVFVLLPGFLVMAFYYIRYPIRNVSYHTGPSRQSSRHMCDIYLPVGGPNKDSPVLIFLTGGAWIIGYKMWGALMGRALCPHGVLLIIPDYRNFPQTDVTGMMFDVDMAIEWVFKNCGEFGGDPRNITLVGQSAGAHLGGMVLLTKAAAAFRSESLKMVNRFSFATVEEGVDFDLAVDQGLTDVEELCDGSPTSRSTTPEFERVRGFTEVKQETWKPTDLRGFIPISGPYDLVELCDHFQKRGLDKRILDWIFQKRFEKYSPTILAKNLSESSVNLSRYFPPTTVIHGANDVSAPCSGGINFYESLKSLSIKVDLTVYDDMSHTDPILEKPFAGEQQLHKDIYNLMKKWGKKEKHEFVEFDDDIPSCGRVAPQIMINIARKANPF